MVSERGYVAPSTDDANARSTITPTRHLCMAGDGCLAAKRIGVEWKGAEILQIHTNRFMYTGQMVCK